MKAMNGWMNEGMNKKMNGEKKSLKKGLDERTKKINYLETNGRVDRWLNEY